MRKTCLKIQVTAAEGWSEVDLWPLITCSCPSLHRCACKYRRNPEVLMSKADEKNVVTKKLMIKQLLLSQNTHWQPLMLLRLMLLIWTLARMCLGRNAFPVIAEYVLWIYLVDWLVLFVFFETESWPCRSGLKLIKIHLPLPSSVRIKGVSHHAHAQRICRVFLNGTEGLVHAMQILKDRMCHRVQLWQTT